MRTFALALMMTACSVTPPAGEPTSTGDVVLQPETVLLDGVPGIQDVVVDDTQVVLWTDGTRPDITVGSVVVGTRGGGVLRRVTQVQEDGRRFILTTAPAKLTDAVAEGYVRTQIPLGTDRSETVFDLGGRVLYDEVVWSDEAGNLVFIDIRTGDDAHAAFTPIIEHELDIGFLKVDAEFEGDFTLEYEADIIASVDGAYSGAHDFELMSRSYPFTFMLGEVPVWGTATVDVSAHIEADVTAAATATVHTEATAWAVAKARFHDAIGPNNREWAIDDLDGGIYGDKWTDWVGYDGSDVDASGKVSATLSAVVTLELYDSAGAQVGLDPWLDTEVCADGSGVGMTAGVDGFHRYTLDAVGWNVFDSGAMPFTVGEWDLMECPL